MLEFLLKIIICFLLSACIGVERQYRGRKAGLRTVILVSLGAFLFVNFSFQFPKADATRVASQVVAGIGFLGAGVIIKDTKKVKGLTTAATLWCSAALGILCAGNMLFEAAVGTLFILFTNIVLRSVNRRINSISGKGLHNICNLNIVCNMKSEKEIINIAKALIEKNKGIIENFETEEEDNNIKIDMTIIDNLNNGNIFQNLLNELSGNKEIISISLNKGKNIELSDDEEL